ncbi:MAG: hypothetical protein SO413_04150, partial [Candidatus Cryptobacteroides sp.]|nr:hypothetical protein [Candidatus Cryptobacteroides sp.]
MQSFYAYFAAKSRKLFNLWRFRPLQAQPFFVAAAKNGRCRRNHSSLPQQKLESSQISAKFLNAFRANPSKIHKYL